MAEENRPVPAYARKPVLSKIKIANTTYYLKDADARAVIDTIYGDYLKAADKTELSGLISAEVTRATAAEEAAITSAVGQAKKYADDELAKKQNNLTFTDAYSASNPVPTKKYVDDAVAAIETMEIEIVTELPTPTAALYKKHHIYLKKEAESGSDEYDEYIIIRDGETYKFEKLGSTRIDLTNYYTKSEIDAKVETLKGADTALGVRIDGVASNLAAEADRADKAEKANKAAIEAEVTRATDAESKLSKNISDEVTRAQGVESGLNTKLTAAEGKIRDLEGKPAAKITQDQISKWDNEVGAKKAAADEKTRAEAAEQAINTKIGNSTDLATADTIYGAINKEIAAREKGDTDAIASAKSYTDTAVSTKAEQTYVDGELAKKVDKATGKSLIADTEITRLAGIETGAQVNVIEHIKLNGKEVNAGENKTVDLGTIATSGELSALAAKVTAAEGDIDTLEGKMATVQGTGEGSISKAKQDAIDTAKEYADAEDAKLKTVQDGAHTHTVTGSVTFVPNLTPTVKHLSASASGTELNVTNSEQFMKSVAPQTSKLVRASFVNKVEKVAQNFNNLVATVGDTIEGDECLVLSTTAMSFSSVGNVDSADAATGALDSNGTGDTVAYGLADPTMGAAVTAVSVKTNPTITLSNTGASGVEFLSNVVGASTSANLASGLAVEAGAHTHVINKTGK